MSYIILAYIIFLILFVLYSTAAIYHLWRFGYVGDLTKPVMVAYIILSSLVIMSTIVLIITTFQL